MTQADQLAGPFQFSLLALLAATAVFALVLGLTISFNAPELFAAAGIGVIAWIAQRFTNVDVNGLIAWCGATELLIVGELLFRLGVWGIISVLTCSFISISVYCLSCGKFFYAGVKSSRRKRNIACGILAIASPIVFIPSLVALSYFLEARETAKANATMQFVSAEVKALHTRLGRTPNDEVELIKLLGKSLPTIHSGIREIQVEYKCLGPDEFQLNVGHVWSIYTLIDSQQGEDGWSRTSNQ